MKAARLMIVLVVWGTLIWGLVVFAVCRRSCQWLAFDEGLVLAIAISTVTIRLWLNIVEQCADAMNDKAADERARRLREPVMLNVGSHEEP